MRVLLLAHAFNSLTQRLFIELAERGHEVSVELDINDRVTEEAVALFRPDAVVAPFLKRLIPESVWRRVPCFVVHPGIPGDRGPSALDWAILEGESRWGVSVLRANGEYDAGSVMAWAEFPMRAATKGSLYRHEVTEAAVRCVLSVLGRLAEGIDPVGEVVPAGRPRLPMRQKDRAINWTGDGAAEALRKIRASDGAPGVLDETVFGAPFYLYDAHPEPGLQGRPGRLLGRFRDAVAVATAEGAVWIGHLKPKTDERPLKLPAIAALGAAASRLPRLSGFSGGPRDIAYEEANGVGYIHFAFHNGAMSTGQCRRLGRAYAYACDRPTRVIVLTGGSDFWSNGIHLGMIEAAADPALESWLNINAMNDLALNILTTESHATVAAMRGNVGAGGVFLALAADRVLARRGIVLNPHYKDMGNLYGSEYWTYVLPRRVGVDNARAIAQARLPMGTAEAFRLGLVDAVLDGRPETFVADVRAAAEALAADTGLSALLADKRRRRAIDEAVKPLEVYRAEELERMRLNFYGFDSSYHVARFNFIRKVPKSRTPATIARHRRQGLFRSMTPAMA